MRDLNDRPDTLLPAKALGQRRLPSLDGWRAIAILLVLLSHYWATNGGGLVEEKLGYLAEQGNLGVRIFFVLSGFLITYFLLEEYQRFGEISLRKFYIRRVLRIFPVYFFYLAVLLCLSGIGFYHDELSTWLGAITFTRNFIGRGQSATGHFWSLAVEEQFYLLWPSILVGFKLGERPRLAVGMLLGAAMVAVAARAMPCSQATFICQRIVGANSTLKYADSLAIGCICAYLFIFAGRLVYKASGGVFFLALITLAVSARFSSDSVVASSLMVFFQAMLIAGCIVLSITTRPFIFYSILNSRLLSYVGVLSYSLYVWHFLFLAHYMGPTFTRSVFYAWLSGLYDWKIWLIPTLLVSALSYHFLERPMVSLRRRFAA